jgi:hypothetical protein
MRTVSIALAIAIMHAGPDVAAADRCSVRSDDRVVPLIELYTSEGCSSCPPADRWLSSQIRSDEHRANWLAFHVDYWDELGWPDRFASPKHTQRQRRRVNAAGGSTVYTPQVMIGKDVQTVWRASPAVARALDAAGGVAEVGVALVLERQAAGTIVRLGVARSGSSSAKPASVWLAQTSDAQETRVRAGENAGATLRHDRVVEKLWGPWPLGSAPLAKTIDTELGSQGWGLTAFVEHADGRVLQSLRLSPADCGLTHPVQ